jgi:hypothetical protein
MAKKLLTTVHLTDEKGVAHTFGPQDELPGWAQKHLAESWGDRDDLWEGTTNQGAAVTSAPADEKQAEADLKALADSEAKAQADAEKAEAAAKRK